MGDRRRLCEAGLHDMTEPGVRFARKYYSKTRNQMVMQSGCAPCRRERERLRQYNKRRGLPHTQPTSLEYAGPRTRRSMHAVWQSYRRKNRPWPFKGTVGNRFKWRPTASELEVFNLVAQGFSDDEIGLRLFVSKCSTKSRVERLMKKMGVHSRAALCAQLLKRGYIRPDKVGARRAGRRIYTHRAQQYTRLLRRIVEGDVPGSVPWSNATRRSLWSIQARNEAHAVSILWAAGRITSRDVPQTRNIYLEEKSPWR